LDAQAVTLPDGHKVSMGKTAEKAPPKKTAAR
jgi:hypothetical protein